MAKLIISNSAFNGNTDCFQSLIDISNFAPFEEKNELILSNFIDASPFNMLVLAIAIKKYKDRWGDLTCYIPNNVRTDEYMQYMGFYDACEAPVRDINKGNRRAGRYICITKVRINPQGSIEADYKMIENEAIKLTDMFYFDKKLAEYIKYCFFEMIRNVYEHADTDYVYVCAQYWPKREKMEISIADEGCGIKKAMEKRFHGLTEMQLINYAMLPGMSALSNHEFLQKGDYYENSGYGLYMTKEFAIAYNGEFILCSGNYAVKYSNYNNEIKQDYYLTKFAGTAISISFCTNLQVDFNYMRNKILNKAEKESNKYSDAIHKASRSSGGQRR